MGAKEKALCLKCIGTGRINGKGLNKVKCPVCRGRGFMPYKQEKK